MACHTFSQAQSVRSLVSCSCQIYISFKPDCFCPQPEIAVRLLEAMSGLRDKEQVWSQKWIEGGSPLLHTLVSTAAEGCQENLDFQQACCEPIIPPIFCDSALVHISAFADDCLYAGGEVLVVTGKAQRRQLRQVESVQGTRRLHQGGDRNNDETCHITPSHGVSAPPKGGSPLTSSKRFAHHSRGPKSSQTTR
jgi:hypothetical protein